MRERETRGEREGRVELILERYKGEDGEEREGHGYC
jgi:hypothetical protein